MPIPTETPVPVAAETIDDHFHTTYGVISGHQIEIASFNVMDAANAEPSIAVQVHFDVDLAEYKYLSTQIDKASLQDWGDKILADMESQWPNRSVVASLAWVFYTDDYSPESDCFHMSDRYTSGKGFRSKRYLVYVNSFPEIPSRKVLVCKF
jgi:hypothetical protein